MCQTNNIQKKFPAGTICYKVLHNSSGIYFSMYYRKHWKLGQVYRTYLYNHKLSSDKTKHYSKNIGPGFFHAFPTLDEAIKFQQSFWCGIHFCDLITKFPIAEMRIPEDVDGFSGTYSDYDEIFDSIAVPILEFVKMVD